MAKFNGKAKLTTVYCRTCLTRFFLDEQPMLFDIVSCPECAEDFEVVGLSPVRLDWPSDFDDDDKWLYDKDDDDLSDYWGQKSNHILR